MPPEKRVPRRLSREARRAQLVEAALPLVARDGAAGVSLDEVAERAGVTRNLLYHYFPRGRADVFAAVAERAGEALADGWVTDPEVPLEERLARNFGRMVQHAEGPSDEWRVFREARAAADPQARAAVQQATKSIVRNISTNHLGTDSPPPVAAVAIGSFLAFCENALDEGPRFGLGRAQLTRLLRETLVATIRAASEGERAEGRRAAA